MAEHTIRDSLKDVLNELIRKMDNPEESVPLLSKISPEINAGENPIQ